MTFTFKNEDIKEIVTLSAQSTAFLIPYEGDKIQKAPTLWIVADRGVYLCPSIPGLKYPLEKKHIAYAVGYGPNMRPSIGDGIYDFPLSDQLIAEVLAGHGLEVSVSDDDETTTAKTVVV